MYSKLFVDGGKRRIPCGGFLVAYRRGQAHNRLLKILGINWLDKVRLRPGAQSRVYVARVVCGRVEQYRSVRVELANGAAQPDSGCVRQPIVQDVEVEISLSS